MAQWLSWGDGSDGSPNAISGTVNTYATCTGTAGQTVLTTTLAASDGDQILVHQTQHATAAGTWEIVKVSSDGGATLNLYTALVNSYTTGAQAVLIPQYTGGDISGAVTGTAWNGSVGGIVALMSNGNLTVSGSITAPNGFRGGAAVTGSLVSGKQGEGVTGNPQSQSRSANANGAGGGVYQVGNDTPGGGGGSNGTQGENGQGTYGGIKGDLSGNEALTLMTFGGGGGSGCNGNGTVQLAGYGAGIVFIIAKNFTLTGSITLTGTKSSGATNDSNDSGSGAGGSCLIKTQVGTLGTTKITALGGTRNTNTGNRYGGAGGAGRIHLDYGISYTGTTNPTLDVALDNTLSSPSSGFFNFF